MRMACAATTPSTLTICCSKRWNCWPANRLCSTIIETALTTYWWTSIRTPTPRSTNWCACSRARSATSAWSATTTSPSTAGAGRTSATSSILKRIFPTPKWSNWNRTTAPPPTYWTPPIRSSPTTAGARKRRCGPRPARARRSPSTAPSTSATRPPTSPPWRGGRRKNTARGRWRCSTAPTPSRACWKRRSCARARPTASTAG